MNLDMHRRTVLQLLGAGVCGSLLPGCEPGLGPSLTTDSNNGGSGPFVFGYPLSKHDFGMNNPMSVVCMGDSITRGQWVEGRTNYPALLRQRKPEYNIVNEGINGQTTTGAVARVNALLAEYQPGWLLVLFGVNDIVECEDAGTTCDYAAIVANLQTILEAAMANQTIPIIATLTPSNWGFQGHIDALNVLIRELADDLSVKLLDLAVAFEALLAGDSDMDDLFHDGLHLSNAGANVMAQQFDAAMQSFSS